MKLVHQGHGCEAMLISRCLYAQGRVLVPSSETWAASSPAARAGASGRAAGVRARRAARRRGREATAAPAAATTTGQIRHDTCCIQDRLTVFSGILYSESSCDLFEDIMYRVESLFSPLFRLITSMYAGEVVSYS